MWILHDYMIMPKDKQGLYPLAFTNASLLWPRKNKEVLLLQCRFWIIHRGERNNLDDQLHRENRKKIVRKHIWRMNKLRLKRMHRLRQILNFAAIQVFQLSIIHRSKRNNLDDQTQTHVRRNCNMRGRKGTQDRSPRPFVVKQNIRKESNKFFASSFFFFFLQNSKKWQNGGIFVRAWFPSLWLSVSPSNWVLL